MRSLHFLLTITLIFMSIQSNAQADVTGEYYLRGVMEVGSGFKLNADSTFQFFFSYGALDRYGEGKWSLHDNKLLLNSRPYPGRDFKLIDSGTESGDFIVVKIKDNNPQLYSFVHCLQPTGHGDSLYDADASGSIRLPRDTKTIRIVSEFSTERISVFNLDGKFNTFTFAFEPWIAELFFNNFPLHFGGDYLEGKHPLLDDKVYRYEK